VTRVSDGLNFCRENQGQARAEHEARLDLSHFDLGPVLKTLGLDDSAIPTLGQHLAGRDYNAAPELGAREELEARLSLGPILKTLGINAGLGAIPAILDKVTGGDDNSSSTRELAAREELEARLSLGPILKTIGINAGLGALISSLTGGNNTRREPEPLSLGSIGKGLAGIVASLGGSEIASQVLGTGDNTQRDLTPEETIAALSLISKRSPEPLNLAGIGKGLAGIVAGLLGSQVAQGVLGGGNSTTTQRDLTPEALAALGLISKRSPEPLNLAGIGKGLAGIIASLAGSQVAEGVLGGSNNTQRDLTPEETLAALGLISKREISMDTFFTKLGLKPSDCTLNQLD